MKIKIRVRKGKGAVAAAMEPSIASAPTIAAPSATIDNAFAEGF